MLQITLILSIYAAIVATYFLYTRVEHAIRHWRYAKWIEKERSTPISVDPVLAGVVLPYEVGDQITEVMDSDEREWKAEQEFKNKRGE